MRHLLTIAGVVFLGAWSSACKTEVDRETYVGNWSSAAGDLLITPSKGILVRQRDNGVVTSFSGQIVRWEGTSLVVESGVPLLSTFERTVNIDKAPFHDADGWKLHWNGNVLARMPDHAPFGAAWAEGLDREPPGWGSGVITPACVVPIEHRALIGQWRGLDLEIAIAQDGQVRAEKRGWFGTPKVDGIVSKWTDSGFIVQERGKETEAFAIQRPPEQVDGRWEMTIDGTRVVKVFDGTPVGARGNWRQDAMGNYEMALDRQCMRGFINACILLSREVDDDWDGDDEPLLAEPAQIGIDVHCCESCDPTQHPIRCGGCVALPANGPCPHPKTSDGVLECSRDSATQTVECFARGYR